MWIKNGSTLINCDSIHMIRIGRGIDFQLWIYFDNGCEYLDFKTEKEQDDFYAKLQLLIGLRN